MPSLASAKTVVAALVLMLWLAGTGALAWLMLVMPHVRPAERGRDTPVAVPSPPSADALAEALAAAELVRIPAAFAFYLRTLDAEPALRSGWVVVNRGLTPHEHLPRIARGFGHASVDVVIPEGFTSFDVATRLERFAIAPKAATLAALRDKALLAQLAIPADSAEGYLFPALYRLSLDSPPERVIQRMVGTFRTRTQHLFDPIALSMSASPLTQYSPHQLLTLASIVEREARVPEERPTIAGVFSNRLFDPSFTPHRLQADPTVAYGCLVAPATAPSCSAFDGRRITPAMVRDPANPYSTYRHEGLPPGPICNPGLSAILAVLSPAQHDFFYFVAKGAGRHAFSHSLTEHNRNIKGATP
jgi:UPF0755 protein